MLEGIDDVDWAGLDQAYKGQVHVPDLLRQVTGPDHEAAIDELVAPLRAKTLAEVISDQTVRLRKVPSVDADATLLEAAAVLVGSGCSVAVLAGSDPDQQRFVTLPAVLQAVLGDGAEPA